MRQAVILAGGMGTRLRERLGPIPKTLVRIGGIALLEHQIRLLLAHGIDDVVLLVRHGADQIRDYCAERGNFGARLRFVEDQGYARGTAGAVFGCLDQLDPEFFVLYGDTMLDVDLNRMLAFHRARPDASATLLLHPNDHPHDSDLVEVDDDGRILAFHSKPHAPGKLLNNLVNAALYIVRRDSLERYREMSGTLDFGATIFPAMIADGAVLRGYISPEYIKDAGTPERLDRVEGDYASGFISRSSLRTRQKAVFIDRDGTVNVHSGYVKTPDELVVFDTVGPALRRLNKAGWRSIVVTNQPVIARGDCDFAGLRAIHAKLDMEVAKAGAFFDRIYVCPHHPDRGFAGENLAYKLDCTCRKPRPGLILQACADFNIDPGASWLIGDSAWDISAGRAAGVTTVLVGGESPERMPDAPDHVAADFAAAVQLILDSEAGAARP